MASRSVRVAASKVPKRWVDCLAGGLIAGLVFAIYWQTSSFDFVNFDDIGYVFGNDRILAGLTPANFFWAFTHVHSSNWHPLTTLMHMANCSVFGANPSGHHVVSFTLHALTSVLLYFTAKSLFGMRWGSAWLAAVFAVHPLRVESVAWISELKDVLMALFFVLTLGAYVRYARSPFSLGRYLLVALCFACGLLCKPMLVTVPFVLLLLDYWPLNRFSDGHISQVPKRVLWEKVPLLLLAAAPSITTLIAQKEAFTTIASLTLPLRIENAIFSGAVYVWQTFFPLHLAVFYPFPEYPRPAWQLCLLLTFLVGITAVCLDVRHRQPWFLVGWLWFVIMLIPVIGLIQVGNQAHADRYTYLPQIGLLLIVTFPLEGLAAQASNTLNRVIFALSIASVATFAGLAWVQTGSWRDSETLWSHALTCSTDRALAHLKLGAALQAKGHLQEAAGHYWESLAASPTADAHNNLATVLEVFGDYSGARRHYRLAIGFAPGDEPAYANLGKLLASHGDLDTAIRLFRQALAIKPNDVEARCNLGLALALSGKMDSAIAEMRTVLTIQPEHIRTLIGFCRVCTSPEALAQATPLLEKACADNGYGNPVLCSMLAAVYSRSGKVQQAGQMAQKASRIADLSQNVDFRSSLRMELDHLLEAQ